MKKRTLNLRHRTLVAAVLCALPAYAMGQTPPAPAAAAGEPEKETIVVTGSNIRGAPPVGAAVIGIIREDIVSSGAVTTAQMLQQIPQIFNLGISENSRGQAGGAGNITYGSAVNLRGIGAFTTLALVNGHRVVQQGTSGFALDPSIIPTLGLERVEVVADGASAVYGSDAIAGVVNLILRRNVEQSEVSLKYGKAKSYDERQLGAIWGHRWSGGQVTVAFENASHSALNGQDRDFFRGDLRDQGGGDFRSTQCAPGNIVIAGVSYAIPVGGVTAANASSLVANTRNFCDNIKYQDLIPKQEHNALVFTWNQELSGRMSLYGDGLVARRTFTFRPTMLNAALTVPSTNAFYVRPPGAPAGTSETVQFSYLGQLGQNTSNGYSQQANLMGGLEIKLLKDWKAAVEYDIGRSEDLSKTFRGLNNAAIAAALASNNPATALNVFGGTTSQAVLDGISNFFNRSPGKIMYQDYKIKADGPLFSLPAGDVRVAVGYEGQRNSSQGGTTVGAPAAPVITIIESARSINSVYAEMLLPVFGPKNAVPGMRRLDLNIAGRFDDYSDVGSTSNPKFGVNWSPVDTVMLRGSYGTSFRAPGFSQLRGNTNGLFVQNYSDPTNGGALRVGVALSGGDLNLKPETSRSYSFGMDWEPIKLTKFNVTFFDLKYEKQVVAYLSDLTILNREAQFDGTGIILRSPSAAFVADMIARYPVLGGTLPATWTLFVDGRSKNLGVSNTRGYDFSVQSRMPGTAIGSIGWGLSGTYFTKYDVAITPVAPLLPQLNTIFNPLKLKMRGSLAWERDSLGATLFVNYTNSYNNNLANPVQRVASYTTADVRVSYALEQPRWGWLKDTTFAIGALNVLDRKPPFVNIAQSTNGGGGFDPTAVNPIGRIVSVSLEKKF